MKKCIFIIFGLLLVPQLAFASWWNPFSWFRKPVDVVPIVTPVAPEVIPEAPTPQPIVEIKEEIKPVVKKAQPKPVEDRITKQIKLFDDFLEYDVVGANVDCLVLAMYYNALTSDTWDTEIFNQAFNKSEAEYRSVCSTSYFNMTSTMSKIVAEPELQEARKLLYEYAEHVKKLSLYALAKSHDSRMIDFYDSKADDLRLVNRENMLALKRKYNVPVE